MIDNDGFISNSSQQTATSVRENIQNKNLLSSKGDLYIGTPSGLGVLSLGGEGQLLGSQSLPDRYEFVDDVKNVSEIDFKARKCLSYSNFALDSIELIPYGGQPGEHPFDFLAGGENDIVVYQLNLVLDSTERCVNSFAPITFIKKKAFNNYFQINFTQGINDEDYLYRSYESYYYYDELFGEMIEINPSTISADNFNQVFNQYGFLYTKKFYSIFNFDILPRTGNLELDNMLRIDLDEKGIINVYRYDTVEEKWTPISWYQIMCIRIK